MAGGIPAPFASPTVSGYDYGAPLPPNGWNGNGLSYGWTKHLGVDYGTTPGQPIVAPEGGTVKFDTGLPGYGNRITLTASNGAKWIFGHVSAGANGQVRQGDIIGTTGANIGSARGAVTLVEIINAAGQHINPHSILDPIFQSGGAARYGSYVSAQVPNKAQPQNPYNPLTDPVDWLAWQAAVTESNVAGTGATAATGGAIAGATAQANAIANLPQGIQNAIRGLLPTNAHVYRAFFVGVGMVMIAAGILIYFRGDELASYVRSLPGQADAAGADVASVAAPEAAPAIQAAKPRPAPRKVDLANTPGETAGMGSKLAPTPGE